MSNVCMHAASQQLDNACASIIKTCQEQESACIWQQKSDRVCFALVSGARVDVAMGSRFKSSQLINCMQLTPWHLAACRIYLIKRIFSPAYVKFTSIK